MISNSYIVLENGYVLDGDDGHSQILISYYLKTRNAKKLNKLKKMIGSGKINEENPVLLSEAFFIENKIICLYQNKTKKLIFDNNKFETFSSNQLQALFFMLGDLLDSKLKKEVFNEIERRSKEKFKKHTVAK